MLRFIVSLPVVCLIAMLFVTGCGSKGPVTDVPPNAGMPGAKEALEDLGELLHKLNTSGQPLPTEASAFQAFDVEHPAAGTMISNGMIVYLIGAVVDKADTTGNKLVAYQSDAEANGGWVLLSNGEVKSLSASDIKGLTLGGTKP